ncbi:hypothetical protein T492DRAFT_1008224 [Pavlovales sp. CCMP2436]|nr:hypothetical protein T492DRAFT_1008224 [Pavlovales sp. CCMP2436]
MAPIRSRDNLKPAKPTVALDLNRVEVALVRSNALLVLGSAWPPDIACVSLLHGLLRFVQEEGHLTWFLKNHFDRKPMDSCSHATRISLGTAMKATVASGLTIPLSETDFINTLIYAVNHVGSYADRAYVTQIFPGDLLKAYLEIDHVDGSDTVLSKEVLTTLITKIGEEYKCTVSVFKSNRGGNRAHVFTDHCVGGMMADAVREQCAERLKFLIPSIDKHLILDESTTQIRVIRAPFARSPKAHRKDQYTPWIIYTPETDAVRDAKDTGMTIGDWIRQASMPISI